MVFRKILSVFFGIVAVSVISSSALCSKTVVADDTTETKVKNAGEDAKKDLKKDVRKIQRKGRKAVGTDTVSKDAQDKMDDAKDNVNNKVEKMKNKMDEKK